VTAQDVHVPSSTIGGVGSSRQAPTRSTGTVDERENDEDDEDVDQRQQELGPSQL
jgi:hypothetical protein